MPFTTSATMRKMIEDWEGLVLVAAPDVVGVPTVGYGHTGPDVSNGMVITAERADELLSEDLHHFEVAVQEMAQNLNQQRFDALVSFSFNLGEGALHGSTLLRKNNAGDFEGAADEFPKWNHAGGQVFAGLTRRRAGEREMYLSGGLGAGTAPLAQPSDPAAPVQQQPASPTTVPSADDSTVGNMPALETLQRWLVSDGYLEGGDAAVDGKYGPKTLAAFIAAYSGSND